MEPQPNLFHTLGEWWDRRQAEHRARETVVSGQPAPRLSRWLPTRGNILFTMLLVGLLVIAQSVGALPQSLIPTLQSPPSTGTIAYQGRLADADGNPLTDTVPMIFRLYDAAGGGAPLWEEQWTGSSSVQVSDGLFNVMLGSLTPIPASLITSNSSLFLGITVGTDGEMAPRVQLGSVPFAVQALTVPDGSVTTEKIADGAVTNSKLSSALPTLLGYKTCNWCGDYQEVARAWNAVKGSGQHDLIEVSAITTGRPILVHITARYTLDPASTYMCGISVRQNDSDLMMVRLEGSPYSSVSADWACSGSYLFTDLPAGSYTFTAVAWVGTDPVTVSWVHNRQIAVYEF